MHKLLYDEGPFLGCDRKETSKGGSGYKYVPSAAFLHHSQAGARTDESVLRFDVPKGL